MRIISEKQGKGRKPPPLARSREKQSQRYTKPVERREPGIGGGAQRSDSGVETMPAWRVAPEAGDLISPLIAAVLT